MKRESNFRLILIFVTKSGEKNDLENKRPARNKKRGEGKTNGLNKKGERERERKRDNQSDDRNRESETENPKKETIFTQNKSLRLL